MGLMRNQCNWPTQTQCVDGPVSMLSPSLSMTLKPKKHANIGKIILNWNRVSRKEERQMLTSITFRALEVFLPVLFDGEPNGSQNYYK